MCMGALSYPNFHTELLIESSMKNMCQYHRYVGAGSVFLLKSNRPSFERNINQTNHTFIVTIHHAVETPDMSTE